MVDIEAVHALRDALNAIGIRVADGVCMAQHTTFRIGGTAVLAAYPVTDREAEQTVCLCKQYGVACAVVGGGSNLLCADDGFCGCVIFTSELRNICVSGKQITAGAGAPLVSVVRAAQKASLAGLSFAYGIPGTVGGAVYMNAGAYGGEIGNLIESVCYYDIDQACTVTVSGEKCGFGYRESIFQDQSKVILSAVFLLTDGDQEVIRSEMEDHLFQRRQKQPLDFPSAGSAFKRAPGHYTAQLIDEAGLKGLTVGGAQVSEKHAGFIINRGGATAQDVRALMEQIQTVIWEKYRVRIEAEIRYLSDCALHF